MATPVIMPKFGMAQEEATIIRWYKQEGEQVERGEPLLEVMTDKVNMDVDAPASGVLLKAKYDVDDVVPVTVVIGYIGEPGEEIVEEEPSPVPEQAPTTAPVSAATQPAPKAKPGKVKATPAARRLAREKGIDLSLVSGTGPDGLISRAPPQPESHQGGIWSSPCGIVDSIDMEIRVGEVRCDEGNTHG